MLWRPMAKYFGYRPPQHDAVVVRQAESARRWCSASATRQRGSRIVGAAPRVAPGILSGVSPRRFGSSVDDRIVAADAAGPERPPYKHKTLLFSLAVKVFEFPPSRHLVRVWGKCVRSSEPSGDFALTGRSPRVSLFLDKLLSPKSLLSEAHPSVSKPSSRLSMFQRENHRVIARAEKSQPQDAV